MEKSAYCICGRPAHCDILFCDKEQRYVVYSVFYKCDSRTEAFKLSLKNTMNTSLLSMDVILEINVSTPYQLQFNERISAVLPKSPNS